MHPASSTCITFVVAHRHLASLPGIFAPPPAGRIIVGLRLVGRHVFGSYGVLRKGYLGCGYKDIDFRKYDA